MNRPFLLYVAVSLVAPWTAAAQNWPAFRGTDASGVAAAAKPPIQWDVASAKNVAWKTALPGLAHSSPIVWGGRIYVTTAVPVSGTPTVVTGDSSKSGIASATDMVSHTWRLLAIDSASGKVIWDRAVHQGVPRLKRHVKASHASATPATDGKQIVALLGSEGLFCFDMEGKTKWRQDLGVMDVGLVDDPSYQWGPASSPLIFENLVIVLVGARELFNLPVQQYPSVESSSVIITTYYTGASAETVRGFLTTPIERVVSQISGVDYVDSTSRAGQSTVTVHLKLDHNSTDALAEITARLQQVRSELPADAEPPGHQPGRAGVISGHQDRTEADRAHLRDGGDGISPQLVAQGDRAEELPLSANGDNS